MKKKALTIGLALVAVLLVAGVLGGIKAAQVGAMIEAGESFEPPPIAVTTSEVVGAGWASTLSAVGTVVAVNDVEVASEVPGMVKALRFDSGDSVRSGQVLVVLDSSLERAQLASAQAEARLADADLRRQRELTGAGAATPASLDAAEARKAQADASVTSIQTTIRKKTIRAPFAGRVGIREVDLGQILSPGTPVATLRSLDPIYVEFTLPEQSLARIAMGQKVRATTDVFPGAEWEGEVRTINTSVDESTRNVRVRALVSNEDERLRPGMFFDVEVLGESETEVLTIPVTAVLYAPYGDSVYVIDSGEEDDGSLTAKQTFVRLGERRGDLVAVVSGLEAGQTVVSTGAFKLQNGIAVTVENEISPEAELEPDPEDR